MKLLPASIFGALEHLGVETTRPLAAIARHHDQRDAARVLRGRAASQLDAARAGGDAARGELSRQGPVARTNRVAASRMETNQDELAGVGRRGLCVAVELRE